MATAIFPTVDDSMTEAQLAGWIGALLVRNLVVTGLTPSAGAALTLNLAAGEAMIEGFRVEKDAAETLEMTDATTNYVYLALTRDAGDNVTGATFTANTTGVAPADSVQIAKVVTSGGAISAVTDVRKLVALGHVFRAKNGVTVLLNSAVALMLAGIGSTQLLANCEYDGTNFVSLGNSGGAGPAHRLLLSGATAGTFTLYIKDNAGAAGTAISSWDREEEMFHGLTGSATVDIGSIAAGGVATFDITVTGAQTGDPAFVAAPSGIEAGLIWSAYVSAADTVTVRVHNTTGGAIDPASATWSAAVLR